MEIATALFAPIATAAEGLGAAATSLFSSSGPMNMLAGTAAQGGAAGLGSTALSVLQGAAGLGAMMSSISQGSASADSSRLQAIQADGEATQEQIAGVQRTTALKRELARAIGQSDVVYAAGGTDIGSGIAEDARQTARSRAASEISVDRSLTDARIALQTAKASGYRRLASSAETAGYLGAATQGVKTAFDIFKRG